MNDTESTGNAGVQSEASEGLMSSLEGRGEMSVGIYICT